MSRRLFAGFILAGLITWAAAAVTIAGHLRAKSAASAATMPVAR